jgi:CheY-like chemotaxis protein
MTLGKLGLALETAALGRDGLELARRLQPRLILLDYVLPDIRGSEVCAELARDPATAGIPIVVMSAKGDDIRPLFKHQRAVVEFIAKPFSPPEITHLVEQVLARIEAAAVKPSPAPATNGHGTARIEAGASASNGREAAARLAFSVLRDRLARIPEWYGELNGQAPATFFARKLLTPEVVGNLVDGLVRQAPAPASQRNDETASSPFSGSTAFLATGPLLRLVADSHRSGELRLAGGDGELSLYFDRGDLVLALARDADAARRTAAVAGHAGGPTPEQFQRVLDEARALDLPALALLAKQGLLGTDPRGALHRHGRQVLIQALGRGPLAYTWRDGPTPEVLQGLGRPIALDQLALERLRLVDDWSQIELQVTSLDQVCERVPDFREHLTRFELNEVEQRVLMQINGRHQVKDLVQRSGVSTFEVFHILYRLMQVRLVRQRAGVGERTAAEAPILICDADERGVRQPLARWLASRAGAPALVEAAATEVVERIVTAAPRLALVDAADETGGAVATAVRGRLEISDTTLVALVPRWDRRQAERLTAAGFDVVLPKPVHLRAIARLLDA